MDLLPTQENESFLQKKLSSFFYIFLQKIRGASSYDSSCISCRTSQFRCAKRAPTVEWLHQKVGCANQRAAHQSKPNQPARWSNRLKSSRIGKNHITQAVRLVDNG